MSEVNARLTDGHEVYQSRSDLYNLPFWKCDTCHNFVGCHHQTNDRTRPLGVIANPEIKNARKHIHALLDPVWKNGLMSRKALYRKLSSLLGYEYHTANIRSIEEARNIYKIARSVINELGG